MDAACATRARVITLPRRAQASFPPELVSAREARRFLRAFLDEVDREDLLYAAEQALSEIVTNAILHARTDLEVSAELDADGFVRVEVSDRNPQLPVQRNYADQATTGRGMQLVATMTHECGVQPLGADGKTVWFVVPRAEDDPDGMDDDALLSAWHIDPTEAARSGSGQMTVVLKGLPPTLWLAAREHQDAMLRELALFAVEHPHHAPAPDQVAIADQARTWISTHVLAELDRVAASSARHRALPTSHPSPLRDTPAEIDCHVSVGEDATTAFSALQDVLDTTERLAGDGLLLARPGLPEIVAVRDWACEQAIAQLAGVAPSPWPGTGHERFVLDHDDRAHSEHMDWDASIVTEATRGAVAADDANRIIAVSRTLAAALGWSVADLVGRRVIALIPPELREAHVAGFTRHLTTGEAHALGVPLVLPVLRADGTRVDCDFLVEQLPTRGGRPIYVAWIDPHNADARMPR
jgi:PAS domain S-box-containing protein